MRISKLLAGFLKAAGQGSAARLEAASELDPSLLAKARKLALGVGTAAGAFGSLVGAGGGVLIGPIILNTCPAVPQRIISGTSLAAVATTGATAGAVYWTSNCVEPRSAVLLATTAVLMAPFGAKMTHRFDCQRLRQVLGYWLYCVAPLVPLKGLLFAQQQPEQQQQQQQLPMIQANGHSLAGTSPVATGPIVGLAAAPGVDGSTILRRAQTWAQQQLQQPITATDAWIAGTGSVAGFASGLLGIGGGTVVTPLLAMATGAPQQTVLGTSLVAMVLPSLVGLVQHQRLGNVDWKMAVALALGTTVGSYAGSNFAINAPAGVLEGVFAVGMLLLGRRTLAAAAKGVPKPAK